MEECLNQMRTILDEVKGDILILRTTINDPYRADAATMAVYEQARIQLLELYRQSQETLAAQLNQVANLMDGLADEIQAHAARMSNYRDEPTQTI